MLNKNIEKLKEKANKLPLKPGVYIMRDSKGNIIYIGKAKKLKNRVSQYFKCEFSHTIKVREMVSRVEDFDYIVTDTEFEALVLECSLIKKNKPKYNILLKDDKGYYYIKITNELWPKIKSAKLKLKDKAKYIGPYTSIGFVSSILDNTLKIFKLPDCNRNFGNSKNLRVKSRACLNYYIGQCSAPCIGKISFEDYIETIKKAELFLTKNSNTVVKSLKQEMEALAENLEFEKAAKIRDQLITIKKLSKDKQKVLLSNVKENIDFIALATLNINENRTISCFKVFNYCKGQLENSSEYIFKDLLSEPEIARSEFIQQYYYEKDNLPEKVFLDGPFSYKEALEEWLTSKKGKKVEVLVPKAGGSLKIIKMCLNNAKEIINQKLKLDKKTDYENNNIEILEELKKILDLKVLPKHIEIFDVSNLKDSDIVCGMVVFSNGKPNKKLYKRFRINTFKGQDDYRSMQEVITRRFKEYEKAKQNSTLNGFNILPDLILLDGGKGHVGSVKPILKQLELEVPVFGMVKDKNHKTRALTSENEEILLNKSTNIYKFIYKMQEEVHRYSINYNKILRSKRLKFSSLTEIPGVGEKLSKKIMEHFKTLENIKKSSLEEIESLKGVSKKVALNIFNYFKKS